ncbi:uncharacterized protein [Euwallacea fornicatus]|uniref:uncharacterized protein isoform X1 n=1 Tax=Euwallacea fornicatus TaxID=995702 RepID=UPI00338E8769
MGNKGSTKAKFNSTPTTDGKSKSYEDLEERDLNIRIESIQRDDMLVINVIKKELKENVSVFILNNLIMGTQFFSDHREVITRLQHISASPQEKEMNKTLLKDETMECTYPDAIMDEVNKNVIFRPPGEFGESETLVTKRIYVINDLIEVVNSGEIPQYTSIDKPCYQVKIDEAGRKGFVKLLQVEKNSPMVNSMEYDIDYDNPIPGPSSRSDSEYDYSRITDLRTPKPIEVSDSFERRDTLPKSCFTRIFVACDPKNIFKNDSNNDSEKDMGELDVEDFTKELVYINSNGFMGYFQNGLFPTTLGKSLGFSENAIKSAKAISGKIFCDEFDTQTEVNRPFEVIPAVAIPWPEDQTIEFVYRDDRPTIVDTRTGTIYKWPTSGPGSMIEEIRNMTAVLVPKGYAKKKGVNMHESLEWEINFPKAERYLEARMSHAQMKCMLLLLTLHKTFIAPVTQQNGLLVEHIRTHMFWECERDYRSWPEHRLGTKLLRVIKSLQHRLFLGVCPDYFIKERNLFENIPKMYLNYAQKLLLDVLANPVPFFIKALGNLRYSSGKFYTPLNLQILYEKIITKSAAIQQNPQLAYNIVPQLKRRIYKDPDRMVQHLKELKRKERIIKDRLRQKEEQQKYEEAEHANKMEIDVEEPIDKELDMWKTKSILSIFIENFIAIGKESAELATISQGLFYLKQATYLAKILEDCCGAFLEDIRHWRRIIAKEEAVIKRKIIRVSSHATGEGKPRTPLRNSTSFNEVPIKFVSETATNPQALRSNNLIHPNLEKGDTYSKNGWAFKAVNSKKKTVVFVE